MHITIPELFRRIAMRTLPLRVSFLVAAFAGIAAPAMAVPTGCALTTTTSGAVFDKAFQTVSRDAMPSTVTVSAPIVANCTSSNGERGSYRWTITLRTLTFTMLSGATPSTVVARVGRRFSAASSTLEVSERVPDTTDKAQATVNTTGQLWYLTNNLLAGRYRLSQVFDVSEEYCKWTGNHLTCKARGAGGQYRADFTLTVVDPPPTPTQPPTSPTNPPTTPPRPTEPPPASGSGTVTSPGRGIKPNPWTVRGYAAKQRCEKCDELRNGG